MLTQPGIFTWIPIYTELAEKLLAYRDRQNELLGMIRDLKNQDLKPISTDDKDSQNKTIALAEIDPFTFFANFNRGKFKDDSRSKILKWFKEKFSLTSELPNDFPGIPVVPPYSAWFFAFANKRQPDDIPSLWELAKATVSAPPQKLDPKLFDRCLRIERVGPAKLTMGMFWLNPRQYVALDENNRKLFEQRQIDGDVHDLASYLALIERINAKLGEDYPTISQTAWQRAQQTTNAGPGSPGLSQTWIFQANPDDYDLGGAVLKLRTIPWRVTRYKNKITSGDRVYLWESGRKAGIVALAKAGPVNTGPMPQPDVSFQRQPEKSGQDAWTPLQVLGIVDPVLQRDEVASHPELANLLILRMSQGTNFAVEEKEAQVLESLLKGRVKNVQLSNSRVQEPSETELEAHATNLILYGPPGTGKTYQTIERSVQMIDPTFSGDHSACKQKFDQLVREKRIAFITFHQSYSYEDFVEGIRPVLDQEGGEPRYECRAGIFKQLAVNALFDCLDGGSASPTEKTYTDDEKSEIVQRFLAEGDTNQLKSESQWKPYVLIIDEINRGNISKILGELITLIEPDKRVRRGDDQNTLVVTLPYSGDKFAVPANLFLLATMNTADKSIALVDVALRRRFEFKELRVDFGVCKNLPDRMRLALAQLNQRIRLRKDRDHEIGHAYFMNVGDEERFNQTFRLQIIPLLQEYFYNDWDGLRYILGENSQEEGSFIRKIGGGNDREVRNKWQWFFDAGIDDLNCLQALCGNYQIA